MIKILVVEDSKKDIENYRNVLDKNKNIKTYYALSAEEALRTAEKYDIDIFILDIELPGMSGLELAGIIRNMPDYSLSLILFITGYAKNQLEAFKQFHCYDYIIKPFNSIEFNKKITTLIEQYSVQRQKKTRVKMLLYPEINREILVPVEKIKYAEVLHRRCYLYTELREQPFESNTIILKELINEIDDDFFIQCYRSFAVNVKKIQEVEQISYRLWTITLQNLDNKLYVSSKYYISLEEKLKTWITEKGG